MKTIELVKILLEKGISISGVTLAENGEVGYIVDGFSKSGSITLYDTESGIEALQRYGGKDIIESFDDMVNLAWYWFTSYSEREPFTSPDRNWLPYFLERGLVKPVTTTSYVINR